MVTPFVRKTRIFKPRYIQENSSSTERQDGRGGSRLRKLRWPTHLGPSRARSHRV